MAKNKLAPCLIFASDAEAAKIHGMIPGSRIIDNSTGPLALRLAMVDHANGEFETLIATPRWATGWRAPIGTKLVITNCFPSDMVEQAKARVPAGRVK